jgi:hypothetical protein
MVEDLVLEMQETPGRRVSRPLPGGFVVTLVRRGKRQTLHITKSGGTIYSGKGGEGEAGSSPS